MSSLVTILEAVITLNEDNKNSLPAQVNPFPTYPILHIQTKLPSVFLHSPLESHGVVEHSSTSTKIRKYENFQDIS